MKKTVQYLFCLMMVTVFLSIVVISGKAFCAEKALEVLLRVKPQEQTFRCETVERAKEFAVTNASKQTVTIKAVASHDWIIVSPLSQPEVRPLGTALFSVTVNCTRLHKKMPATGVVLFEALNGSQKAYIRVNPPLEPLIRKDSIAPR
jgi:hypothetical protein